MNPNSTKQAPGSKSVRSESRKNSDESRSKKDFARHPVKQRAKDRNPKPDLPDYGDEPGQLPTLEDLYPDRGEQ